MKQVKYTHQLINVIIASTDQRKLPTMTTQSPIFAFEYQAIGLQVRCSMY